MGRARQFIETRSRPDPGRDDDATLHAADYLRALCTGQGDRVLRSHPALHAAHRLHEAGGELRWELEARLLARQSSPEVAAATGLDAALIDAYEKFFFSVRDRLDARDWVAWKAVGALDSLAAVWKAVAYHGGPLALEVVMACTSAMPRAASFPDELLRKARRFVTALMAPAGAILAETLRTTEATTRLRRPSAPAATIEEIIALAGDTAGSSNDTPIPRPQPDVGRTSDRGATRAAA